MPTPDGWRWVKLTDVARLESGHTPSRRTPSYWEGDIPWIGIKDAADHHGRFISDTVQHVSQAGIDNSAARILPAGTVCLSRTASIGYATIMARPMATSQDFANWVCSDALNPYFLLLVLLAEQQSLLQFAYGTTHQTIYFPELKALHVCLPSRVEQDSICEVLSALNDKIDQNRRVSRSIVDVSRAFYDGYFAVPAQARNWPSRPIGECVTVVGGSTPDTEEAVYWENGSHHWATPKDLSQLTAPVLLDTGRCITDAGLARISSGLLPHGTVLLSSRAPIGYLAIAEVPVAVNQGFIAIRCTEELPNLFMLQWLARSHDDILARANGSTFLEINKSNFRAMPIIVPPRAQMDAFMSVAEPLHARLVSLQRESRYLARLRDELLPKLLSGEVRVGHAEATLVESGV
jgi:type I restriction enzyme S subunit